MHVHNSCQTKLAVVSPLIVDLSPLLFREAVDFRRGAIMLAHAREMACIVLPRKTPVFSHLFVSFRSKGFRKVWLWGDGEVCVAQGVRPGV